MQELMTQCPSGWFSPTFYEPKLTSWDGRDLTKLKVLKEQEAGFYFNFDRSEAKVLFSTLLLLNPGSKFKSGETIMSDGIIK